MACAGIAFASATPSASAKTGYVWPGFRESQFSARGTNGFKVTVTHRARRIELHASNRDGIAAIYVVPAPRPAGDGRIRARFPGVGEIAVRFLPSGRPKHSPPFSTPECTGGGEIKQRGTFSGRIKFAGERGYTKVIAHNAQGFTLTSIREVCEGGSAGGQIDPPGHLLASRSKEEGRTTIFSATRYPPGGVFEGDTTYAANSLERRQGMWIARVALIKAEPETFSVSGPPARPSSASVAPPPPFRGSATFEALGNQRARWEGTLEIDLPGAPGVRLAGASFASRLCRNQLCRGAL